MTAGDAVATAWAPLTSLPRAREDGKGGYYVSCPTDRHQHGDRSAGLHVTKAEDGAVLVHCFAGCDSRDVLHAVGCTPKDLYPDTPERHRAQTKAARSIEAPPDPHMVALCNAEYQACLDGWMAASRVVAEAIVDSVARQHREREWVEVIL
jgi:hypothetical protein